MFFPHFNVLAQFAVHLPRLVCSLGIFSMTPWLFQAISGTFTIFGAAQHSMGDFIRKNLGTGPHWTPSAQWAALVFSSSRQMDFFSQKWIRFGGIHFEHGQHVSLNSRLEGYFRGSRWDKCYKGVVPGIAGPPSLGVLKRAKLQVRTLPSWGHVIFVQCKIWRRKVGNLWE